MNLNYKQKKKLKSNFEIEEFNNTVDALAKKEVVSWYRLGKSKNKYAPNQLRVITPSGNYLIGRGLFPSDTAGVLWKSNYCNLFKKNEDFIATLLTKEQADYLLEYYKTLLND